MKAKIEEFETKRKIKNIRYLYKGINNSKKGYQPRTHSKVWEGWFGYRLPQYFWYVEERFLPAIECT